MDSLRDCGEQNRRSMPHVLVAALQVAQGLPQWASATHWTQVAVVVLQCGSAGVLAQWASVEHCACERARGDAAQVRLGVVLASPVHLALLLRHSKR